LPLALSDEELATLQTLAQPIDQRQRNQFLIEVAAEIEATTMRTGIGPGPGLVHRIARGIQRKFWGSLELDSEDENAPRRRPRDGSHA
jgi:hypothetical protein